MLLTLQFPKLVIDVTLKENVSLDFEHFNFYLLDWVFYIYYHLSIFCKKNVTLVWLINLHAYVHSLLFSFFWTFLLSSNVAKTYLSIPWEIDSVVGCTLEIIHLLPVCKGKAKMAYNEAKFSHSQYHIGH